MENLKVSLYYIRYYSIHTIYSIPTSDIMTIINIHTKFNVLTDTTIHIGTYPTDTIQSKSSTTIE